MSRGPAILLALCFLAAAPAARAQHGVMQVSATVVNTCFFGAQARCLQRGTLPVVQLTVPRPHEGAVAVPRRIVHF